MKRNARLFRTFGDTQCEANSFDEMDRWMTAVARDARPGTRAQKVVRDNESWARLRSAFSTCIGQFGNGAYLASEYIGGQSVNRDFKGTEKARDPITPISGEIVAPLRQLRRRLKPHAAPDAQDLRRRIAGLELAGLLAQPEPLDHNAGLL